MNGGKIFCSPGGKLPLAICLISLFPYLANSFFNEPSMDDYRYAVNYQSADFGHLQSHMYHHWSGRYAATALLYLGPLSFGSFVGYKLASLVLFLGLLGSIYFVLWPQLGFLSALRRHLIVLLGFGIWMACLPTLSQGIYWFSGAYTYLPGVILFNCLLGSLLRLRRFRITDPRWEMRDGGREGLFVVTGLVFMGVTMGLNEIIVLCLLPILFLVLGAAWWRCQKPDPALLVVTLGSLCFVLVSFLAPGNAVRSSHFEKGHDLWLTLRKSPAYVVWFAQYFLSLPLLLALAGSIRPLIRLVSRVPEAIHGPAARGAVGSLALLLPLAVFTLGVWATGVRPARRALNVLHYYEFALLGMAWCQWVLARPDFWGRWRERIRLADGVLWMAAGAALSCSGNNREAWVDLFQRGPAYREEIRERYARVARGGDVVVAPIVHKPKTLFFEDITEDPTIWQNVEMARYFRISSIRLSGKDPSHSLRE